MAQYRKKPVEIEAHQLTVFNLQWVADWCGGNLRNVNADAKYRTVAIPTLEGVMEAKVGDWIIRGVKGEFYPCQHDIFQMTYEVA